MGKEAKDADCLETLHHFLDGTGITRGLHAQEGSHVVLTLDDYLQDLPDFCLIALLNCFGLQLTPCHFHAHLHLKGNEKRDENKGKVEG